MESGMPGALGRGVVRPVQISHYFSRRGLMLGRPIRNAGRTVRSALFMSVVAVCRSPLKIFQFSLKSEVAVWGADFEARLLIYD